MNQYVDTYDYLTLLLALSGKVIAVNSKDESGRPIQTGSLYGKNYRSAPWFQDVMGERFYTSQAGNVGGEGAFCESEVPDKAIGFDEKYGDRIFEPFQRVAAGGCLENTGMGLALCRKIAERHGRAVTARSCPGQ